MKDGRDGDARLQPHVALVTGACPQSRLVVVQRQGADVLPVHVVPERQARVVVPPNSQQGAVQLGFGALRAVGAVEVDVGAISCKDKRAVTRTACSFV